MGMLQDSLGLLPSMFPLLGLTDQSCLHAHRVQVGAGEARRPGRDVAQPQLRVELLLAQEDVQHALPRRGGRQADVQPRRHPAQDGLVEVARVVGGDEQEGLAPVLDEPVRLRQQRVEPAARPVVVVGLPLAEERVGLVDEDDAGVDHGAEVEEALDGLLRLADVLVLELGGRDVDHDGAVLVCQHAGEVRLASSWRAVEEDAVDSGVAEDAGLLVGVGTGQVEHLGYGLLQIFLYLNGGPSLIDIVCSKLADLLVWYLLAVTRMQFH